MLIELGWSTRDFSKIAPINVQMAINKYNKDSEEYRKNLLQYVDLIHTSKSSLNYNNVKTRALSEIDNIRVMSLRDFNKKYQTRLSRGDFEDVLVLLSSLMDRLKNIAFTGDFGEGNEVLIGNESIHHLHAQMIEVMIMIIVNMIDRGMNSGFIEDTIKTWTQRLIDIHGQMLRRARLLNNIDLPREAVLTLLNNILRFWEIDGFQIPDQDVLNIIRPLIRSLQ